MKLAAQTTIALNRQLCYFTCTCTTVKHVQNSNSKIDKPKILMTTSSLMKVESTAECSSWNILQYSYPALSDSLS